jgi:hypothetical protein
MIQREMAKAMIEHQQVKDKAQNYKYTKEKQPVYIPPDPPAACTSGSPH